MQPGRDVASTRLIALSGNLAFGSVNVGSSHESTITINSGTTTLTVTGMTVSGGRSDHTRASRTSGAIAPGTSQTVRITLEPVASGTLSGTLTVNGDQHVDQR